jgi:hypothetical protein
MKKVISIFLSLAMLLSIVSVVDFSAFAEDSSSVNKIELDTEYYIETDNDGNFEEYFLFAPQKTGKYVLSFDENEWSCQFWITSNAYGDDNTDFELIDYGEHLYLNSDYVYKIRCKGNYWNYDQSIKRKFRFNISDLSSKTLILGKKLETFYGRIFFTPDKTGMYKFSVDNGYIKEENYDENEITYKFEGRTGDEYYYLESNKEYAFITRSYNEKAPIGIVATKSKDIINAEIVSFPDISDLIIGQVYPYDKLKVKLYYDDSSTKVANLADYNMVHSYYQDEGFGFEINDNILWFKTEYENDDDTENCDDAKVYNKKFSMNFGNSSVCFQYDVNNYITNCTLLKNPTANHAENASVSLTLSNGTIRKVDFVSMPIRFSGEGGNTVIKDTNGNIYSFAVWSDEVKAWSTYGLPQDIDYNKSFMLFPSLNTYFACYYELNGGEVVITPTPAPQPSTQPTQETQQQAAQQTAQQQSVKNDTATEQVNVAKPKSAKFKKVKSAKNAISVEWKKVSGVKGYQVQVATDKKFKKNKKTVNIKKQKATKTTVKKLKAKKKYYVRVRTYKIVNGKKVYSSWSKVKSVKTK